MCQMVQHCCSHPCSTQAVGLREASAARIRIQSVGLSVGRMAGWLVGRLVGWSAGRSVGWSVV